MMRGLGISAQVKKFFYFILRLIFHCEDISGLVSR
jgi:hypothetical protein